MNHQPYLDWAFADPDNPDEALTSDQVKALQTHLDGCEQCRMAALAWDEVQQALDEAPVAAPPAGFTARWQRRLEARQAHDQRRQGFILLGTSLGLAFFLLALLIFLAWPLIQSPGLLLWAGLYQAARWLSIASTTQQFLGSLLQSVELPVSLLTWLLAAGLAGALCLAWVVSYRFLTQSGNIFVRK